MKSIVEFINESRASEQAEKEAQKYLLKYHGKDALEFKTKAEKDGWKLDDDYDKWTAGDEVIFKYIKNNEKLYVTYSLSHNDSYKGDIDDDELKKLKTINGGEYYRR